MLCLQLRSYPSLRRSALRSLGIAAPVFLPLLAYLALAERRLRQGSARAPPGQGRALRYAAFEEKRDRLRQEDTNNWTRTNEIYLEGKCYTNLTILAYL